MVYTDRHTDRKTCRLADGHEYSIAEVDKPNHNYKNTLAFRAVKEWNELFKRRNRSGKHKPVQIKIGGILA